MAPPYDISVPNVASPRVHRHVTTGAALDKIKMVSDSAMLARCEIVLKLTFWKYPPIHTNYIISHSLADPEGGLRGVQPPPP